MALIRALLLWGFHMAVGSDVESMIQHSLAAQDSPGAPQSWAHGQFSETVSREMMRSKVTKATMAEALDRDLSLVDEQVGMKAAAAAAASNALVGHMEGLRKGMDELIHGANASGSLTPLEMARQVQAALSRAGLPAAMRRAMSSALGRFDSTAVGFETTLSPTNTLLRDLGLPGTISGPGRVFANFAPNGEVRVCFSGPANASEYPHNGTRMFVGLTKWDKVGGKSFGVYGGRFFLQSGLTWTLAEEPEVASFYMLLAPFMSVLQTASQQGAEAEGESAAIPGVPPQFIETTWCTSELPQPAKEDLPEVAPFTPSAWDLDDPRAPPPQGWQPPNAITVSELGSLSCPNGDLITDEAGCRDAASTLPGKRWDSTGNWNGRPSGCYTCDPLCYTCTDSKKWCSGQVWFNTNADGPAAPAFSVICKQAPSNQTAD